MKKIVLFHIPQDIESAKIISAIINSTLINSLKVIIVGQCLGTLENDRLSCSRRVHVGRK